MTDVPPLLSGSFLTERAGLALGLPLPTALGVRLLDERDPAAGVRMAAGDLAGNGAGGVHAGAMSVALELAGYLALAPSLTAAEHAVTHSVSTVFVGSAPPGHEIRARGTLDRRTRRLAFLAVTAEAGRELIARCTLVKSVVPFEHQIFLPYASADK